MRPLSAHDILHIWEWGQGQHPVDRALTFLVAASPEITRDELAALSVGQRDARLLTLRQQTFGSTFHGFAECPQCAKSLEFAVAVAEIRASEPSSGERALELVTDGLELRFRLPNSWDLAAVAGCEDAATARHLLVQRCVLQVSRDGMPVPAGELAVEVTTGLATRMVDCDPQAEVLLDFQCPACGHRWQMIFDIVSFFWAEICAQAKRLLREVHTLARAYGWCEADILAMTAARRQSYLDMVT